VRKQRQALEDVSHVSLGRRKVVPIAGIEQGSLAKGDLPGVWSRETGNAIKESRFSRTRGAEQNGEAGRRFKGEA